MAAYEIDWNEVSEIEDDDLVDFVVTQFDAGKIRRQQWEIRAATQLAWCEGDQDKEYDISTQDLITRVEKTIPLEYQQKVEINSLKGFIFQRIALLLGQPITLAGVATSIEPADIHGAKMQTKLLQYMWHTGDESVRRQMITALWMMFATGIMFIHPYWDPFAGKKDQFGPKFDKDDDQEVKDGKIKNFKQLAAQLAGKSIDEMVFDSDGKIDIEMGEVRWDFRTGFDITEPEFCDKCSEAGWLIDSRWRTIEYMRHRYGDKADEINPDAKGSNYLSGYRSTYNPSESRQGEVDHLTKAEIVLCHTLWRPRSPWAQRGIMAVICDQAVMYKGVNPYPHGEIPLIPMQEMPSHHFRPRCTVYNLMKLQEARNRTRSQMAAAVHLTIAPKIIHEKGANLPENAFDRHDRQIEVAEGYLDKVKPWDAPQLPREAFAMDQMYRSDMQDVSAVHDSTSGRGESKQQSGRHAAIVVQGDSRATLVTRELVESAIAKAGGQSLWLWWKFVPTERAITISGDEFRPEVLSFKGSDLLGAKKGEPGAADFNVIVKITTDNEPEQILNKIQLMTEMKYWNPANPADRLRVARMLGDQSATDHDDESRHRRNATIEHELFKKGEPIRTALGDNDELHIEEHYQWTTTSDYKERIKNERPSQPAERLDTRVEVHIAEHMRQRANKVIMPAIINRHEEERIKQQMAINLEEQQQQQQPRPQLPGGPNGRPAPSQGSTTQAAGQGIQRQF